MTGKSSANFYELVSTANKIGEEDEFIPDKFFRRYPRK